MRGKGRRPGKMYMSEKKWEAGRLSSPAACLRWALVAADPRSDAVVWGDRVWESPLLLPCLDRSCVAVLAGGSACIYKLVLELPSRCVPWTNP